MENGKLILDVSALWLFGGVIVFLLICAALVYLIVVLRNLNKSTLIINQFLEENKDKIAVVLEGVSGVSKDVSEVTETLKEKIFIPLKTLEQIFSFLEKLILKKIQ